jgi:hypothetical protein
MGETVDMYVGETGDMKCRVKEHRYSTEMCNVKYLMLAAREKGIKEILIFVAAAYDTRDERMLEQRDCIVQAVFASSNERFRVTNRDV